MFELEDFDDALARFEELRPDPLRTDDRLDSAPGSSAIGRSRTLGEEKNP